MKLVRLTNYIMRILDLLERLRLVERQLSLVLVDTGLTLSQFRLLLHIASGAPISATRLSTRLGITKASTTTQLKELEKAQLIDIASNRDDKRSSFISLSRSGEKRLELTLKNVSLVEKHINQKMIDSISNVIELLTRSAAK